MKTRSIGLATLLLLGAVFGAEAAELTVTVENVRNDSGDIRLAIFASPAEWPSNATSEHKRILPTHPGSVVFKIELPPGTYAINGYHDENCNQELDRTAIGFPEEGYFFSNNVRPFLSAPSFAAASFNLAPEGAAIMTSVVYP